MTRLQENEIFGLVKTDIDVHTLGITTIAHLLRDCGYECYISPNEISVAVESIYKLNNFSLLQKWISDHKYNSYRF